VQTDPDHPHRTVWLPWPRQPGDEKVITTRRRDLQVSSGSAPQSLGGVNRPLRSISDSLDTLREFQVPSIAGRWATGYWKRYRFARLPFDIQII
jgi:hypothetical protein